MAEKKGKFNIIDLIVIIVIIVIAAGAVYKFSGLNKTAKKVSMETVTYDMKIEALRDFSFKNIQVGDTVFDYTSGNAIGTIKDVQWLDATRPFYTTNGETVEATVENRYDVILTVEAQATVSDGVYSVNKTYDICANSKRKIYTKCISCTAKIISINE
ncbi:hypothetical protein SDC9_146983 [bioreactor metagenome]|uniref:DUF4330 domain-containing protein n=1 Tax=bioreactor metagenome TaxID=1076179 RepID=A0A645EEN4_9ZZZZ|nr:DUF4330 domain-containing protein [Candidatus Metalachnospira sp.]